MFYITTQYRYIQIYAKQNFSEQLHVVWLGNKAIDPRPMKHQPEFVFDRAVSQVSRNRIERHRGETAA